MGKPTKTDSVMLRKFIQTRAIHFALEISCILTHWFILVDCFGSETVFVHCGHAQNSFVLQSSNKLHPSSFCYCPFFFPSFIFSISHGFWLFFHQESILYYRVSLEFQPSDDSFISLCPLTFGLQGPLTSNLCNRTRPYGPPNLYHSNQTWTQ